MTDDPVYLSEDQQTLAVSAIVEEVPKAAVEPSILAIGAAHRHLLARFGGGIRAVVGQLKAAATRRLHVEGLSSNRAWCRGCPMKSKPTEREFRDAFHYVLKHQSEGSMIHIWPAYEALRRSFGHADGKPSAWKNPD